jgi:hypothetical protein
MTEPAATHTAWRRVVANHGMALIGKRESTQDEIPLPKHAFLKEEI